MLVLYEYIYVVVLDPQHVKSEAEGLCCVSLLRVEGNLLREDGCRTIAPSLSAIWCEGANYIVQDKTLDLLRAAGMPARVDTRGSTKEITYASVGGQELEMAACICQGTYISVCTTVGCNMLALITTSTAPLKTQNTGHRHSTGVVLDGHALCVSGMAGLHREAVQDCHIVTDARCSLRTHDQTISILDGGT